jgi:saccharopine dehydrogenase (NAD+, L-lysine-forming)
MARALIVGAGGVGNVVAHKCAQVPEAFSEIVLASRRISQCEEVQKSVRAKTGRALRIAALDADDRDAAAALLRQHRPDVLINVALPYQDLPLMDACLEAGVHYVDTAVQEQREVSNLFEYKPQWDFHARYREAELTAILGSGFDPGVTNAFCAYAHRELFDTIETVDILDCNAGSHGRSFATNFNAEINIREITQHGCYWEEGQWIETEPLSINMMFDFPQVGPRKAYLIFHEEMESLVKYMPGLKRVRFWMTFSDEYLAHLRVLRNVGMTRIDPVEFEGHSIVPLRFLKSLLPDPGTLGPGYSGLTSIGCLIEGQKNGRRRKVFLYNVCDHAKCFEETRAQAVSYTTGVPAMAAALMIVNGAWKERGVLNIEQLDPSPYLEAVGRYGLPWHQLEY